MDETILPLFVTVGMNANKNIGLIATTCIFAYLSNHAKSDVEGKKLKIESILCGLAITFALVFMRFHHS